MIQAYLTAYYAREWGNLIGQGLRCLRFFHDAEAKIPAFSRDWKGLSSFFRSWSILFRDGWGYSFFKRIAAYDWIWWGQIKARGELEIYAEKTWEDFFRRVHKAMNVIQPLVFVFVALWLSYSMQPCCCRFIKIWRFIYENIKNISGKSFYADWNVGGLIDHQCVLLLLFVPNLTKQKTPWKRQVMQPLWRWSKARLNCMNSIIPMTKPSSKADCWWKYYQQTSRILPCLLCEKNSGETRAVAD